MNRPKVVSRDEWLVARNQLLAKEKELTRAQDALSAERRRLPMVRIEKEYVFEGPAGKATLSDLFEDRRQLVLYHFMFGPSQEEGCDGCSMVVDNMGHPAHLNARDMTRVLVSRAPLEKIEPFKEQMGWTILRDSDEVYHTYFTDRRGVEYLGSSFSYFDLTPYGRQEDIGSRVSAAAAR